MENLEYVFDKLGRIFLEKPYTSKVFIVHHGSICGVTYTFDSGFWSEIYDKFKEVKDATEKESEKEVN